jgi:hypothetical protein
LGTAAAAGAATTHIRSDATIAVFDATAPTTSAVADSAATGSVAFAARRDHVHGREAFAAPVAASPAGNSTGSATTINHSDHVHQGTGTGGSAYYAQVTADQTGITTATDLTGLTVTVTTVTGRRYRISFGGQFNRSIADGVTTIAVKEGATVLQQLNLRPASGDQVSFLGEVFIIPTAGSHTYKLTMTTANGTGDSSLRAASTDPSYICIQDCGT